MDNTNALNWFEIPATDISRAKKFYEAVFAVKMDEWPDMNGMKMAGFPADMQGGKVSGSLVQGPMHKPSMDGVVVYLNANPDMNEIIDRIAPAGGKIVMPRTQITPEIGYMAMFTDTEGNKVALHSSK